MHFSIELKLVLFDRGFERVICSIIMKALTKLKASQV